MEESSSQSVALQELRALFKMLDISTLEIEALPGRSELQESFVLSVLVDKETSRLLIGQHGLALAAIQYLLHALVRKTLPEASNFSIDINEYWAQKRMLLEKRAKEAVRSALYSGQPVWLSPMSSYERKIAYCILSRYAGVSASSVGQGAERRIIVTPIGSGISRA